MSFKKIDLDTDVSYNFRFVEENYFIFADLFSGSSNNSNIHYTNHYFTNNKSGSYYIDVFDKRYDDLSSNRLCSITYGYTSSSIYYSGSFSGLYKQEKNKMYRMFAKRLLGDEDKIFKLSNKQLKECIFLSIARNQYKDTIKPKNSSITMVFSGSPGDEKSNISFSDLKSNKINQEWAGPYSILTTGAGREAALCFLKAGIFVIDPEVIMTGTEGGNRWSGSYGYEVLAKGVSGTTFNDMLHALHYRFNVCFYTGQSKISEAYYKCAAQPDEFNYSSNPSFVGSQKEIISMISSSGPSSTPTTYITQVGLLGQNNELLAVGKLLKPIKKDPSVGAEITVRIDQ